MLIIIISTELEIIKDYQNCFKEKFMGLYQKK